MSKKSKTIMDLYNETKTNHVHSDFPVGTHVKVVVPGQDFNFFYGETGTVTKNNGGYLGITVKFDIPRKFKDGSVQNDFNFQPCDLEIQPIAQIDRPANADVQVALEAVLNGNPCLKPFYIGDGNTGYEDGKTIILSDASYQTILAALRQMRREPCDAAIPPTAFTCRITVDHAANRYDGEVDIPDDMDSAEQLTACSVAIRNIADFMITRLGCPAEAIAGLVRELVEPQGPEPVGLIPAAQIPQ